MRIFKSNRIGRSKAQTMVEFALVLPILLMIVYGVLEVGRLILTYSTVISASREAARYGSATGLNVAGDTVRYCDSAGIKAAAQNVDFIGVIEDAKITISYDSGPGTASFSACPPDAVKSDNLIRYRIIVTVTTQFTPLAAIVPLNQIPITSSNARTIIGSVLILP
ncbi:MAG: pilus assembly protein [Anaerolineales bacterium]|nr:pilus assembly protein [Anaerolineales bacterium]